MTTEQTALQAFADSCEWEFAYVPHKAEGKIHEWKLTWTVTVRRNGYSLQTPYSAGIGHIPGNINTHRPSVDDAACIRYAVETGYRAKMFPSLNHIGKGEPINPNPVDVLACLAMDSDAIDYPTYEEWASCLGYDPDSRSGERIYRACLEIALHLRQMFGSEFDALREAASEW